VVDRANATYSCRRHTAILSAASYEAPFTKICYMFWVIWRRMGRFADRLRDYFFVISGAGHVDTMREPCQKPRVSRTRGNHGGWRTEIADYAA